MQFIVLVIRAEAELVKMKIKQMLLLPLMILLVQTKVKISNTMHFTGREMLAIYLYWLGESLTGGTFK